MRNPLIFLGVALSLSLLVISPVFSQCADPGGDDIGNCDTLFVKRIVLCNYTVGGYHDESLGGIAIPLIYKNPQTDIHIDSIKIHPDIDSTADIVVMEVDSANGLLKLAAIWFDSLVPGTQNFFEIYFRLGPTWDPAIANPLDTMTIPGTSQTISYTTTSGDDITPYFGPLAYISKSCLEVRDDNRFPSSLRPSDFSLSQNFPNPFNNETVITFALPRTSNVKIEIFNILGQKVRALVDEEVSAGYKKVVWDGKDNEGNLVTSGIYFYRIIADEFVDVIKMTLLK